MNKLNQLALGPDDGNTLNIITANEIKRQVHHLSLGVEALAGLGVLMAYAIDDEVGITGDQVNGLLKCVEYSVLTSQKKIVKALKEGEGR